MGMEHKQDGGQRERTLRKTYQYKLIPTPQQAHALELTVSRCRTLYNFALEQRTTWWGRGHGIGATYYQQATELPDLKAACPEYREVHAQVLQDVLRRVDKTYQAFFRRVQHGQTPGYPRFQGQNRYHSFTYPQYGNGAVLDGSLLSLSKIGRILVRIHRPLAGTPKTVTISREADGWYVLFSCADVPAAPLLRTGRETGIDVGLKVFLVKADGKPVPNPRYYRKAEQQLKKAQRRVSRRTKGSKRWWKAVRQCGNNINMSAGSGQTSTTRRHSRWCVSTTRSIWKTCRSATWCATTTWPKASAMLGGQRFAPSSKAKQYTLANE
jgi:putative transposase